MRLWHQDLLPVIPNQQLLGQHRECCAMRGKGWGKKHSTVDYVFSHDPEYLVAYHLTVMQEMERRGFRPNPIWKNPEYRGKSLGFCENWTDAHKVRRMMGLYLNGPMKLCFFEEHNEYYLEECIRNLERKGVIV